MRSLLIVSKKKSFSAQIRSCFSGDYRIESVDGIEPAVTRIADKRYDFILLDLELLREAAGGGGYKPVLQRFWKDHPNAQIIIASSKEDLGEAVLAVRAGATQYILYPPDREEVRFVLENTYKSLLFRSELNYLRDHFWQIDSLDLVKTGNPKMMAVFDKIRSVAPTNSIILLLGETGTGKSVMARLIHRHSDRKQAQFISVHCGAIPDTLVESELFGHEKGAFTSAVRRKLGKFEIANGGSLFLDEIGTITPSAQITLLEVLQDGTFQRVGGEETLHSRARVIAASNVDLEKMCQEGRFRKDLFYRLNVFPIELPPLRERLEDLPHLVETFLRRLNRFNSKEILEIHPSVMDAFSRYTWPGNIRELENILERAYILEKSAVLTPAVFPSDLFETPEAGRIREIGTGFLEGLKTARKRGIEELEKRYLRELLSRCRGKIGEAAEAAGITTRQLHKLMTKYGFQKELFKKQEKSADPVDFKPPFP